MDGLIHPFGESGPGFAIERGHPRRGDPAGSGELSGDEERGFKERKTRDWTVGYTSSKTVGSGTLHESQPRGSESLLLRRA